MTKFGEEIGGQEVTLPGVYVYTDTTSMVAPSGTANRSVAIVATGKGGNIGKLTRLTSLMQVNRILRGGDAAQMARIAFTRGAREVIISRVGTATPATLNLDVAILADRNPGVGGRSLQALTSISPAYASDPRGTVAFDLNLRDTYTKAIESYRNIGALVEVMNITTGSSVKIEKANDEVTITLTPGGNGTPIVLEGSGIATIGQLATAINGTSQWVARLATRDASAPTSLLHAETANLVNGKVTLRADHGPALIRALRDSSLTQPLPPATPAQGGSIPETVKLLTDWTFFGGGSEGAPPTVQDWTDALLRLDDTDAYCIAVGTGDLAIQTLADARARELSSMTGKRERMVFTGPALSGSKAEMKEAAKLTATTLGSEYTTVVVNELHDTDIVTGELQRYPSYYLAAYAAAQKAANRPADSLTDHRLRVAKLEYVMDDEDCTDLIESGVMTARYDDELKTNIFVEGVTTYTLDNNMILRKQTGMDMRLYLQKRVRQAVRGRQVIGQPGSETEIRNVRRIVEGVFSSEVRDPFRNPNGILTGGLDPITRTPRLPYENVYVEMNGFDLVLVDAELHFVNEISKVGVRLNITPVIQVSGASANRPYGNTSGVGAYSGSPAEQDTNLVQSYLDAQG